MLIILVPLISAMEECQRTEEPSDIPCNIITSYKPGDNCAEYNLTIFNSTGISVQNLTWGNYTPFCNATFNITETGTWVWNSSIESGIIVVEGSRMWIAAILLLPLGLCFFFVYLANGLEEIHNPVKWFFRLIALVMIFIVYQGAHIITQLNPGYESLSNMFSISVYGWIFWVIMAYFLMYILYNIFMSFKHRSEWDFNEDWMK